MIDQDSAESIHDTNPRLLRRYWADLQNWSCEIKTLHSKDPHWSESYISHLSLSRIPDPTHWKLWKMDVLQVCNFCVSYHFSSSPGPEKWPTSQRKFPCVISFHFRIRKNIPCTFQSMSLNIDMKTVRSSNSSGIVLRTVVLVWISLRISSAVRLGKTFHSNSNGSPSFPNNFMFSLEFWKMLDLFFPLYHGIWMSVHLVQTKNWIWNGRVPLLLTTWLLLHEAKLISLK